MLQILPWYYVQYTLGWTEYSEPDEEGRSGPQSVTETRMLARYANIEDAREMLNLWLKGQSLDDSHWMGGKQFLDISIVTEDGIGA